MNIPREDCVSIYTLNTWTEEHWKKAEEALKEGKCVHFGCTAVGHTLSQIVKSRAEKWIREKYGDKVEKVNPDWSPFTYYRLKG